MEQKLTKVSYAAAMDSPIAYRGALAWSQPVLLSDAVDAYLARLEPPMVAYTEQQFAEFIRFLDRPALLLNFALAKSEAWLSTMLPMPQVNARLLLMSFRSFVREEGWLS